MEECKIQINRNWENLGHSCGFPNCITLPPTLAKAKKVFVSYKEFATYMDTLAHQERKCFLNVYNWGRRERGKINKKLWICNVTNVNNVVATLNCQPALLLTGTKSCLVPTDVTIKTDTKWSKTHACRLAVKIKLCSVSWSLEQWSTLLERLN